MDDVRRSPRWKTDWKLKVDMSRVHIPFLRDRCSRAKMEMN
jgi:hypothetical protein